MNSTCGTRLPLVNEMPLRIPSKDDKGFIACDISKLKFVVAPKDEEFLECSKFLPNEFWKSDLQSADFVWEKNFLKELNFP